MKLGFGLSLVTQSGGLSFSPASLFASGEDGYWAGNTDIDTLFQDALGASPVTTTGQTVALAEDKSGNDNDRTQTSSSFRPQYQSGGLLYDGTDDRMDTSLTPTTSGTLAVRFNGGSPSNTVLLGAQPNLNGRCYLGVEGTTGQLAAGIGRENFTQIAAGPNVKNAYHTGAVTWDGTTVKLYLDGSEIYSAAQDGAVDTSVPIIEGALNANGTPSAFWDGTISDAVVLDRAMTPTEITQLTNAWSA